MHDLRRQIEDWVRRARAPTLLLTILALFLGFTVGLALRPGLQVLLIGRGADDGGATVAHATPPFTSKLLQGALGQFSILDLGLFTTVELALQNIKSKDNHEPVLCLGLVGKVKDEVATDGPPTIPGWVLNWIRDYYPDYPGIVAALPECVESWGSLAEIQLKKTYEYANLVIVGYPREVFPSFVTVTINQIVPGNIHTYGSSYLLRITRSGVILIDQSEFREYR